MDTLLSKINFRKATLISLAVMLLLMLWVSKDFGISGDEVTQNTYGEKVLDYYLSFGKDKSSLNYKNVYFYGGFYDMLCAGVNRVLPFDPFDTRHFINAIFGFFAILFSALLAKFYKGWGAALLTAWFLFLSPRFFGESMNNPKDIPFALGMVMGAYFICRLIKAFPNITWKHALWLTLAIGFTIGSRVGGLLLIPFLFVAIGLEYIFEWRGKYALTGPEIKRLVLYVIVIGIASYFLGIVFWPYALQAPLSNPLNALAEMSKFSVNIRMLFNDKHIMSEAVPWYYIPKWIFITSPVIILIGFVISPVLFFKKETYSRSQLFFLFFITLFPWLYIVYKHSPLYDGWRHLLFIYPPLVILSVLTFLHIIQLFKQKIVKYAIITAIAAGLFLPARWGIANYPNEIVYFNEFIGGIDNAFGYYETDYYMNSIKQAVLKLAKEKDLYHIKDTVTIGTSCSDGMTYLLPQINPKIKFIYVRYRERYNSDYDYGIFYSRFIDKDLLQRGYFPPGNTIITIKADNTPLSVVTAMDTARNAYKGFVALEKNDFASAASYYQKAMALDPKNETGYYYYAIALANLGRIDEAINTLNEGLKMTPENIPLYQVLEKLYKAKGDTINAQQAYNKAMAIMLKQQEEAGEE